MSISALGIIATHAPATFLHQVAAEPAALGALRTAAEQFFILPVENMHPLFTRPIPPVRATPHSCLLATAGTARVRIGVADCTASGEVLPVRAGPLYSFASGDVNTGLLCHFRDDFLRGAGPALLRHGPPLIRPGAEAAGYTKSLLHRLLAAFRAQGYQHLDLLRTYLLAVLQELAPSGILGQFPTSPRDYTTNISGQPAPMRFVG